MSYYDYKTDYCEYCGAKYYEDYKALKRCSLCYKSICCYEIYNSKYYCRHDCHIKLKKDEKLRELYKNLEGLISKYSKNSEDRDTKRIFHTLEKIKEKTLIDYQTEYSSDYNSYYDYASDPDCKLQ